MLEQVGILVDFMHMALLAPHELYDEIHPAPKAETPGAERRPAKAQAAPPSFFGLDQESTSTSAAAEEELQKADRVSRYNLSGINGLNYIVQHLPVDAVWPERLHQLLSSTSMWNMLRPATGEHGVSAAAPPVRRALYNLLAQLMSKFDGVFETEILPVAGPIVLMNVWTESDHSVWSGTAVQEAVTLLVTKYRQVWTLTGQESFNEGEQQQDEAQDDGDDDDEDEDHEGDEADDDEEQEKDTPASSHKESIGAQAYQRFLSYLQRGCNGSPIEGYPTVLVVLSTIPQDVSHVTDPISHSPRSTLLIPQILPVDLTVYRTFFNSLWAASDAKLLSNNVLSNYGSARFVFMTTVIDCIVFLTVRSWRNLAESDRPECISFAADEVEKLWTDEILPEASRLVRMDKSMMAEERLESVKATLSLSKGLSRVAKESRGTCWFASFPNGPHSRINVATTDLSTECIRRICSTSLEAFSPQTSIPGLQSKPILVTRFLPICRFLKEGYQENDAMASAVDQMIEDVTLKAIQVVGDPTVEASTRESYANLIVKVVSPDSSHMKPQVVEKVRRFAMLSTNLNELLILSSFDDLFSSLG